MGGRKSHNPLGGVMAVGRKDMKKSYSLQVQRLAMTWEGRANVGVYKYTDAPVYFCVGGCICKLQNQNKIYFLGTICCVSVRK